MEKTNRRDFLKTAGLGGVALASGLATGYADTEEKYVDGKYLKGESDILRPASQLAILEFVYQGPPDDRYVDNQTRAIQVDLMDILAYDPFNITIVDDGTVMRELGLSESEFETFRMRPGILDINYANSDFVESTDVVKGIIHSIPRHDILKGQIIDLESRELAGSMREYGDIVGFHREKMLVRFAKKIADEYFRINGK